MAAKRNVVVIGAGAMGASYGARLSRDGHHVQLIDTWPEHVAKIHADGLTLSGVYGDETYPLPASQDLAEKHAADLAVIFVDSNATHIAAQTAKDALSDAGFAITFQNGIGNVEKLQAVLGEERVLGGSSMCSAATVGPGHVCLTHLGASSVGEYDGAQSQRAAGLVRDLNAVGFETKLDNDIMAKIWTKFILNVSINALCATTGLRLGEAARVPEMSALQDRIIDEALAVTAAKGIQLSDPDLRKTIKSHMWQKFSKPSMMQHIEAAKRTEIDAINGALVREGRALGVPTPYNEALTALLKGRELSRQRELHEPDINYDEWENRVAAGEDV